MNKFGIILAHTYWIRLKSKAFIITTIIALLAIFAVGNFDKIFNLFSSDDEQTIAVIDETGEFYEPLSAGLTELLDNTTVIHYKEGLELGQEAVRDYTFEGLLVLQVDEAGLPMGHYYSNDATTSFEEAMVEQQLQQLKVTIASEQAGIESDVLAAIHDEVFFEKIALDETSKTDEELGQARGIVYVMLFVLYMAVIIYGQMIATDVATEKSSRVMEILISSASPVSHMFAKIIGIALLGLTQIVIFISFGYIVISSKMKELPEDVFTVFGFGDNSLSIYLYALLFFILGYLLYATIAAMLGSLVSRVEDVQQLIMPMVFLIMIAFFIAMFGLVTPDATFITVTSFIPFFSPMIMFLRVGMLDVPIWEISLSIFILIGTIILIAILGARIYRGGVLLYGPSRSLKDIRQAFMLTKKNK